MPTPYPGRETEHDLGDGHSFAWSYAGGDLGDPGPRGFEVTRRLIGLVEHHPDLSPPVFTELPGEPRRRDYCGGYVAWVDDPRSGTVARHRLVAGGPGDEEHLTLEPSLLCPRCGNHGFVRDGRWVRA